MRAGRCGGSAAVGERQEQPFRLSFNGRLRVDFQGARVTSDGGLLLVRELDERLGFGELIERHLTNGRAKNTQLPFDRPRAAVGIQPTGGLRGCQRQWPARLLLPCVSVPSSSGEIGATLNTALRIHSEAIKGFSPRLIGEI